MADIQTAARAPLRVLHVIPSVARSDGGPSTAIVMIERALTQAGVRVVTATTDHGLSAEDVTVGGGTATRKYAHRWTRFYKIAPGIVPWLWRNAREFDVINIHALFSFTSIAAGIVARIRRVPYVIRPLGTLGVYGVRNRRAWLKRASLRLIEGPILSRCAAVHFTSRAEEEEAALLNIPLRGIVIPLGIEASEFPAEPRPVEGKRHVLFLSRLDPKKNLECALKAFSLLSERTAVDLTVAGDGDPAYVRQLKELAVSLGIDGKVRWLGHVDGAAKSAAFADSVLFLLPSHSENFGIAAVEAMLAGLPVVVGKGVAIAGEIEAAGAGIAVPDDPSQVAAVLERLLADEPQRSQMGRRARELALREYSTDAMARRLLALYERVRRPGAASA